MNHVQRIGTIAIYVADLERSRRFYGELLGLRQEAAAADRVTYDVGGTRLLLHESELGEGPQAKHSRVEPYFEVDDVDQTVKYLAERAIPVLQEPLDQPWDEREAIVLDPDGYPVFLIRTHRSAGTADQAPAAAARPAPPSTSRVIVSTGGDVSVVGDDTLAIDEFRSSHADEGVQQLGRKLDITGESEDADVELNPEVDLDLQINAAGAHVEGLRGVLQAKLNVGDVEVSHRFARGDSRLVCNAGEIELTLLAGSDVRVKVPAHARWQVTADPRLQATGRGEWTLGGGAAYLEISGNWGHLNIGVDE